MHTFRAQAINGDLLEISHPSEIVDGPFSSDVDVSFEGLQHQVLSMADRSAFNYENVTGEFTVGDLRGHLIETIDTVATQATHSYQAVLQTPHGAISARSYVSASSVVELIAALGPTPTPRGVFVDPDDTVQFVGPARVTLATNHGLLAVSPLTTGVVRLLPDWNGTAVAHGELFAGRQSDDSPYLTLVTASARAVLMVNGDADRAAQFLADFGVTWRV